MKKGALNDIKNINQKLIWKMATSLYKMRVYNVLNRNNDYEVSSFNARVFS